MEYYTYAYLREDGTPYYIGKGKGNRIYKKGRRVFAPPKDKSRIIFLKQNLTEEEAFKHEIYMISIFGRKDLGTGILHNRTDGGEGASGAKSPKTEEHKNKISNAHKGKKRKPFNEKWKQKITENLTNRYEKGHTGTIGQNNGMSKTWKITFDDGREVVKTGLSLWAKENGYTKSAIYRVSSKKANKHKDIVAVEEVAQAPTQEALDAL
jgi:hypothetical protein